MDNTRKTKKQLIEEIESLKKQLIHTLEERVEDRTSAQRIINKQLHIEIEQRKQAEAELYKVKQFLENIVNGITEQIILISRDFKILWANKTFLEHFGCKIEDLAGRTCYEVTHHQKFPCQPPNDICPIAQVLKTGKPTKEVHIHEGPAGKFYSEVTAYPIKDKKGNILEFVHIARDITTIKTINMI